MKVSISIVVLVMLVSACKNTPQEAEEVVEGILMTPVIEDIYEMKAQVATGDTNAYDILTRNYGLDEDHEVVLPYALLMADKYDYRYAYFDVYRAIQRMNLYVSGYKDHDSESLDGLSSRMQELAIQYLKQASEKKVLGAMATLSRYYKSGRYVPQDTILAKMLYEEYRDISRKMKFGSASD